jgi:glycosyltransferase involved in cell wall biosynthesis
MRERNVKDMKLLSIIVPSYNSEGYLARCLDTLVRGGSEVEVIVVNDGSTDGTARVAQGYCEKYPDIVRLENKPNGGHGSAIKPRAGACDGRIFQGRRQRRLV